ncbi:calpain family cysteine protease [Nonomuraea sp. 3-1Str]|uniref:hypothetical protein n=1 Tax=Nonomuraea sp. 3-1Str TaxID=2929801 RepID=UPI0028638F71|nr:hypothetical protein [Nonomuraea sp. 3-1Str]MDR8410245.1 calpain family cysteine protease [Nonomuraea sp. 3-1Str]
MRGTFMVKSHFYPEGGSPRELPGGTGFAFTDDPPLILGERVRIEVDGEPGWADTAAVIAENGDTGLLIAGKREEIKQVASVSGFVAHYERVQAAIDVLPRTIDGYEMVKKQLETHLADFRIDLWRPVALRSVAEKAVMYWAVEEEPGPWPTILRLCAFRPTGTRKGPYSFLPKLVATAFDQMIGTGNESYDGARLSAIARQSLQTCDGILTANEKSSQAYVVTYAPIHPDGHNLFSTHDQSMVTLSPPNVPRTNVDPAADRYRDEKTQPGDAAVTRLVLEDQTVFPPDGPSGDDVAQGELGTCVLLSTLASIADHDPGQIRRMVKPGAEPDSFEVTFFRTTTVQQRPWRIPQRIVVGPRLPHVAQPRGELTLTSARPRALCGPGVVKRRMTADGEFYAETTIPVTAVMWAPLMERAFAAFAASYGPYGKESPSPGEEPDDGYELIGQGLFTSAELFDCLYGHQLRHAHSVNVQQLRRAAQDTEALSTHAALLLNVLIMLEKQAAGRPPCIVVPTANVSWIDTGMELLPKLKEHQAGLVKAGLTSQVGRISALLQDVLPPHPPGSETEEQVENRRARRAALEYDNAFRTLCANVVDVLWPLRNELPWAERIVKLIAALAPPVSSTEQRHHVFASHAYAICGADLRFTAPRPEPDYDAKHGAPPRNMASLSAVLATLDPQASTITLRNPHHRNSPDLDKALTFEQDTGKFRLTMRDFLEVFHNVTYAVVDRGL